MTGNSGSARFCLDGAALAEHSQEGGPGTEGRAGLLVAAAPGGGEGSGSPSTSHTSVHVSPQEEQN